jgi:hypothetical protein
LGDAAEVNTVKRIFEMKTDGLGYVKIADMLNAEQIPCPKRGRWRNKDQKWSGVTVLGIIQNPAYTGDRIYNRLSFSKILAKGKGYELQTKVLNDRSDWIAVPGAHPPIISKDLFEEANALSERQLMKPNQHYYRGTYLLTGLIQCVHCHHRFQGFLHKPTGNAYYVDGGYINKGKSVCKWFSIRRDILESFVISSVKGFFLDPGFVNRVADYVNEFNESQPTAIQKRLESIGDILRENNVKIENLLAVAEEGSGLKIIVSRLKELEEIQQKLQEERRRLEKDRPPTLNIDIVTKATKAFLTSFERRFDDAPVMERKELLRRMVKLILVDREERKVRCYIRRLPSVPPLKERTQFTSDLLGAVSSPVQAHPHFRAENAKTILGALSSPKRKLSAPSR